MEEKSQQKNVRYFQQQFIFDDRQFQLTNDSQFSLESYFVVFALIIADEVADE